MFFCDLIVLLSISVSGKYHYIKYPPYICLFFIAIIISIKAYKSN